MYLVCEMAKRLGISAALGSDRQARLALWIKKVADRFGCTEVTFVGDRGMIKSGFIDELEQHDGFHYITRVPGIVL